MLQKELTKIKVYKLSRLLLILLLISTTVFADIKLPAIFSNHMVLQQKSEVQFWGWASKGEMISVSPGWSKKSISTKASASGKWRLSLQTPSAGGPYTIIIKGTNEIQLKDVLIGEVWVCSGQSNMAFFLKNSYKASEEIDRAEFPSIRYFSVKRQLGPMPFEDCVGSIWEKTSPETAPSYSAVAYYFAKRIHHALHVPVGIVYAAWGGTPAEAWTPGEVLQNDDSLSLYIARWKSIQENVGKDSIRYHLKLDKWEKALKVGDSTRTKKPVEPKSLYYFQRPWREPGVLFNGMINPIIPYTAKGVIWYQGESNVSYAREYENLFSKMIQGWRHHWEQNSTTSTLPFYFVQIAPFGYSNLIAAAQLRQAQYNVMKNTLNTGMAVTIDLGNMKNVHYTHKKEVGDRLALIALAKDYGFKNIRYTGPECKHISILNGKLILTFDQQLFTYNDKNVAGFEVGYKDMASDSIIYVKAQSLIEGNNIIVWNDRVKNPLSVRYGWLEIGEANLINKNQLPARPFIK